MALNTGLPNNRQFIEEIHKTFGMPGIYKNIEINPVNFAIYSRDYDITNIGPMYKYDATNKVFWANNFDTAGGLPFYRE